MRGSKDRSIKGCFWLLLLYGSCVAALAQNVITTYSGTDWVFPANGSPALSAPFSNIEHVTLDSTGRMVFADPGNGVVVRVETTGKVTVLAGNGLQRFSGDGGPAVSAALNSPTDAAFDAKGNLYIADLGNNRVRMLAPNGAITTIAGTGAIGFSGDGGPAVDATLQDPLRLVVDSAGNLYISDDLNYRIRKVSPNGTISTWAGNGQAGYAGDGGPATQASLDDIEGMAVDSAGNLYLADFNNNVVRKVDTRGIITTIAGNGKAGYSGDGGQAALAALSNPAGVFVDSSNNIYISDTNNFRIRKVNPQGIISTVAGNGKQGFSGDAGAATLATFAAPFGLTVDLSGDIYVADRDNNRVREINAAGMINTVAGNGTFRFFPNGTPKADAFLYQPFGVSIDNNGNIYVADTFNNYVRLISPSGNMSTFAGNGEAEYSGDGGPAVLAGIYGPTSVTPDNLGNVYVADTDNNTIRKITANGTITTIAGNGNGNPGDSGDGGPATQATLNSPQQVVLDGSGNIYISDYGNNAIRLIAPNGQISRFAGNAKEGFSGDGGPASAASLNGPSGIALSSGKLYIADWQNARIRVVNIATGTISTFAGGGTLTPNLNPQPATQVALGRPLGVIADALGNIYFSDGRTEQILKVSAAGMLQVVAGNGSAGFSGDGGSAPQASLYFPYGLALDSAGDLFVADAVNNRIREILANIPTLQTNPASLTFSAASGGALTAFQTVSIASSVPGIIYSLTPTTSSGGAWLKTNVSSGNLPASVQVSVDPTGLEAGNYTGTLQIMVSGAPPASVAVNLSVTPGASPQLGTSSQTVNFSFSTGAASASQTLTVNNTGGGSLNFTASITPVYGGNWATVTPSQGQATPTAPASITLQATPGTLGAGTYQSLLNITAGPAQSLTIPLTMTVSSSAQSLLLSQSALKFTVVAGGGAPLPQQLAILNGGQGTLNWSLQPSVLGAATNAPAWLTVDTQTGASTAGSAVIPAVNVGINAASLTPGEYYGKIQVSAPQAANNPQLVTVVLDVLAPGSDPGPDVEPAGLILTGVAGASPSSQTVSMINLSSQSTTFSIASLTIDGANWLFQGPVNGTLSPGQPAQIVVQPDFTNLAAGTYRGVLTFTFGQGTVRTVNVLAVVAPNVAPSAAAVATIDSGVKNDERIDPLTSASCSKPNLVIQFQTPTPSFSAVVGQPTTLKVQITDQCGNPIGLNNPQTATVTATFTNNDPEIKLTHTGNGIWTGTWPPANSKASQVTITVNAFNATQSMIQSGSQSISGSVSTSASPVVTPGGVVHAASYEAGVPIAPGGLITLYGANLSDASGQSSTLPLPQLANGTQVLLGNLPLPILYTSTGQINVQVPFGTPINTPYQISVQRDNVLSVPQQLVVAAAQPGIFTVNENGSGQGVIFKSDGVTLAEPGTPAQQGETVVIYCTGLGAVNPAVPDGAPAPASPLSNTVSTVTVTIGGTNATVSFSGLTPGFPGLYQVNAVVPVGVSGNAMPVVVTVAGQSSPQVTLAVM